MEEGMEEVARAIEAMFDANRPDQAGHASRWLNWFAETCTAWEVSVGLLAPGRSYAVQFFAANMLLNKVRLEWGTLPAHNRSTVSAALSTALQVLLQDNETQMGLLQRVSMTLTSCAVHSDTALLHTFLTNTLGLAEQTPGQQAIKWDTIVLEGLVTVAEEAERFSGPRRRAAVSTLLPHAGAVFTALSRKIGEQGPGTAALAFRCMKAWLKLDPSGGGRTLLSPAEFANTQEVLLQKTIEALGWGDSRAADAAVDALVVLLGPGKELDEESGMQADRLALSRVISLLAEQGQNGTSTRKRDSFGTESAYKDFATSLLNGIVQVASAIAVRSPTAVGAAHPSGGQVKLAEVVLFALSHAADEGEMSTLESAIGYFDALSGVAMDARPPELRAPLYMSLLRCLGEAARYPRNFWGFEEELDEEDDFYSFRDHVVVDALQRCYGMLQLQYVIQIAHQLVEATAADHWQSAEVALFAIRSVAVQVRESAQAVPPPPGADPPQMTGLLLALFAQVVSPDNVSSMFGRVPWLVEAVCHLIAAYAGWFAGPLRSVLEPAMRYLLSALTIDTAQHSAADAFQKLCTTCQHHLQGAAVLGWLLDTADAILQLPGMLPLGEKLDLVQGLARIVAVLPPEDANPASLRLVTPLLRTCHMAVQQGGPAGGLVGNQSEAVAEALTLMAAALRYMEFSGVEGPSHPVMGILQAAWGLLSHFTVDMRWRADEPTVTAMSLVFERAITALRDSGSVLLPFVTQAMVAGFDASRAPACFDTLATAAELLGHLEDSQPLLSNAIGNISAIGLMMLQGHNGSLPYDEAASLFEMADRCFVSAPGLLLSCQMLEPLFCGALSMCSWQEVVPLRAAINFVCHIIGPPLPSWSPEQAQAVELGQRACLQQHGKAAVKTLLWAASSTCRRTFLRLLGKPLRWLLNEEFFSQLARQWLMEAVNSPDFPGRKTGRVSDADCNTFCRLATQIPSLPTPRFVLLVSDFGSICQREATSDALLAYDM